MSTFVRQFFNKHPLISNCLIYGSLYASAELSQQIFTKKIEATPKQPLDLPSLGRFTFFGTFLCPPALHGWYKWLDGKFPGATPPIVVRKLVLDQLFFTPILLSFFFIAMSALEGKKDLFEELRQKFFPTYLRSCMFWIPASTVNFMFILPSYRVIYVGVCAVIWINILCWIKHSNIGAKKTITHERK